MATLDGKVAIVTGSSSGIGEAIARSLTEQGATVVVNSSTSVAAGEKVAAELGCRYVQADVSADADVARLVESTLDAHGRLDILVNNAGTTEVIPHVDLDAVTDEIWHRILDVNVVGTWKLTRAAVPHLKASGAGSVVNITSIAGVRQVGSSIPYAVSKAGLNHMTKLLANVLGPEIRVNAVAPGLIDTPWTETWDDIRAAVRETTPLKRSGLPDDVAEATLGLLRSTYTTGEILLVDGGMHLR